MYYILYEVLTIDSNEPVYCTLYTVQSTLYIIYCIMYIYTVYYIINIETLSYSYIL